MTVLPSRNQSKGDFQIPDEGVYTAEFTAYGEAQVSQFDANKQRIELTFTIVDDDDFDGVEVKQWFGLTMHEQSHLYPVVKALLGEEVDPDDEIDLEDLIGKRCQIAVVHKTKPRKDGSGEATFANIDSATPLRRKKKTAAAPPPDEDDGAELFDTDAA